LIVVCYNTINDTKRKNLKRTSQKWNGEGTSEDENQEERHKNPNREQEREQRKDEAKINNPIFLSMM